MLILTMKRPLIIGSVILVLLAFGSQVLFTRNTSLSPETDRERIKKFAEANNMKETFVEIPLEKYEDIQKKFREETLSDSPTTYFDKDEKLIVLVLKRRGDSGDPFLRIDLSSFSDLKVLVLSGCGITDSKFPILPGSLTMLDLSKNRNLTSIDLNGLTNLENLKVGICGIVTIKSSQLPNSLKELNLNWNSQLTSLELKGLDKLEELHLSACDLTNLYSSPLTTLNLKENKRLKSIDLRGISNLLKLNLSYNGITAIESGNLPDSLNELDLSYNSKLISMNLSGLTNIKTLGIMQCDLKTLNSFIFPGSLTQIKLHGNSDLKNVSLNGLTNLENLDLIDCGITHLTSSQLPDSLQHLYLGNNKDLKSVDLKRSIQLELLDMSYCGLKNLNSIKFPHSLRKLILKGNEALAERKKLYLDNLATLETLDLSKCGITDLDDLHFPPSLKELQLNDNRNLSKAALKLEKLEILNLSDCSLTELDVTQLPELEKLYLDKNRDLSIDDLGSLNHLQKLSLAACNIKKINLSGLPELTELYLHDNEDLDIVKLNISKLKMIELSKMGKKIQVHPVQNDFYIGIAEIKFLQENANLTSINFRNFRDEEWKYQDCSFEGDISGRGARIEIEYEKGQSDVRIKKASELNERERNHSPNWIGTILCILLIAIIIVVIFCTKSRKLKTVLSAIPLPKIIKPIITFSLLFSGRLRYRLLSDSIPRLMCFNLKDLQESERESVDQFYVYEVKKEGKEDAKPINSAIPDIQSPIVLRGKPGTGKITFVKFMVHKLYKDYSRTKKGPIPVFFKADQCQGGVLEAIAERIRQSQINDEKIIEALINEKIITIFIDGLSVGSGSIIGNIKRFVEAFPEGNILISTELFDWEPSGSKLYEMKPLRQE